MSAPIGNFTLNSSASPVAAPVPGAGRDARVHSAIARAAERTGVDFSYLLAQAKLESSLNPDARAPTSSATGLYQFIDSTWLRTLDRHGAAFGMDQAADAINVQGGRAKVGHPATREAILAMRYNPETSAMMAGALALDNSQVLESVLGRKPDSSELYLAHFLGAGGASNFLSRMAANPEQSAAALMPKAARANRTIFYERGGSPRSLSAVMELIRGKMAKAGASDGSAAVFAPPNSSVPFVPPSGPFRAAPDSSAASSPISAVSPPIQAGPIQRSFAGLSGSGGFGSAPSAQTAKRPSMASMLEGTFAAASGNDGRSMPAHVRDAYQKLKAFDL